MCDVRITQCWLLRPFVKSPEPWPGTFTYCYVAVSKGPWPCTRPRHQDGAHGGRAPAKNRQGPAKITGLFMLKNPKKPNGNPVFHGGCCRQPSHTHSYPGCHAPDRLVVALADHGCSPYTTPCLKKLCKIVFTRTSSNLHQFWYFLAERW